MEITWGFLLLFTVFVFPGLIIRRLYFFGEFSKQFGYNDPLLKTLAYALVPGLINAIGAYLIYGAFRDVEIGRVLDSYKDMANLSFRYSGSGGFSMDANLRSEVLPFLLLLYGLAVLIGAISGQLVRWTAIDTKLKLFRFKNHWFYLFTGEHRRLTKYKPHFDTRNRLLFVNMDVMVESGGRNHLYSGVLVDYELSPDDCRKLSKVVITKANRYTKADNGSVVAKAIPPGEIFIVDCTKLVNINLKHVYEPDEARAHRRQGKMQTWTNWVNVLSLISLIFLFFRIDSFEPAWYAWVMDLSVFAKLVFAFVLLQTVQLFNINVQDPETKVLRAATGIEWIARAVLIIVFFLLTLGAEYLARAVLGWFE